MRVFITGGTGFIGKFLVKRLEKSKHQVLILTRKPGENYKNISFLKGNLSQLGKIKKEILRFNPDAVLHLAWEGIPDYGVENSLRNLSQGIELYKILLKTDCKKIICSGSLWEYGNQNGKVSEKTPIVPFNIFTAVKNSLNVFGREIFKDKGIDFIWTRIFYVYGPGQKPTSLIPYLISSSKNNKSPEIRNIDAQNDFIYVEDVAEALLALLNKQIPAGEYNIGSGRLTAVRDIISLVNKYLKKDSKTENISQKQMDQISAIYADISKIKKFTGWAPKVKMQEAIRITILSFK